MKRAAASPLTTSLILIAPLYLAYEVGVMFSTTMNGVDFVTYALYTAVGSSRRNFLLLHLAIALALLVWVVRLRRRGALSAAQLAPLCAESAVWALGLGTVMVVVVERMLHLAAALAAGAGDPLVLGATGQAVVISLGAGVHEELVFRLILLGGLAALLRRLGAHPRLALAAAVIGSALLFAAAHHLGARGEPFTTQVFVFRALAGAVFGLIFWYRSLAHAVYAHAFYDLYVLVLR
ncbi:MAG TPA: CPBP family intramembrane glutamic endopeptidase [Kofleriaceae bacterium]|nr:CPBP family intramembrane glutamic endopeptidase [Kofleriaceae bacterium]